MNNIEGGNISRALSSSFREAFNVDSKNSYRVLTQVVDTGAGVLFDAMQGQPLETVRKRASVQLEMPATKKNHSAERARSISMKELHPTKETNPDMPSRL